MSALKKLAREKDTSIADALHILSDKLDRYGLDILMEEGRIDGFLARPRALEFGMALNRLVSCETLFVSFLTTDRRYSVKRTGWLQ